MGLDVRVLQVVRSVGKKELDKTQKYPDSWWGIFKDANFPGRNTQFLEGTYECDELYHFRAGSYSGHGQFRTRLAQFSGLTQEEVHSDPIKCKDIDFFELINFYDNEGVLDYITAGKLLKDFNNHLEEIIDEDGKHTDYIMMLYNDWLQAFRICYKAKGLIYFT